MKRILFVDDDVAMLKQLAARLAGHYKIFLAKSGNQALALAAEEVPDLILLDVSMPDMDGYAVMDRLRSNPALCRIPVIFLTASYDPETQAKTLAAGGVDIIKKPFETGVLLHRISLRLRLVDYLQDMESSACALEDTIISSFAELIERRDRHKKGCVWRIRKHVRAFGRLLLDEGYRPELLDETSLLMMERAAPLHDIGIIGVSDGIILKPGPLTDEEYALAKTHTTIGAATLKRLYKDAPGQGCLLYAQSMAEGHHERFDGKGYPHRLKGEAVPLCCRLLSLVSVYDALVTTTVYRPAMDHASACRLISDEAGKAFDPVLARFFLQGHEVFAKIAVEEPL